jgi:hypothetical protein
MSGIPWSSNPKENKAKVDKEISSILTQVDKLLKISHRNRFMLYAYVPLPGSELYYKAIECGFNPPKTLEEWSGLISSPEDIFQNPGYKERWITDKQFFLITMLEQYIFGMMDIDAKEWLGSKIKNRLFRYIFRAGFTLGYWLARLRLKLKIFTCPVDFVIFTRVRRLLGV